MSEEKISAPRVPCGSCPYRKDVPSGIWHANEYDKLVLYDAPTWDQPAGLFMCHQNDGKLCGGWVGCHGVTGQHALLALRMNADSLQPAVFDYHTGVPLFRSGAEAREHGIRDFDKPGLAAKRKVAGLMKLRGVSNADPDE